MLKKKRKNLKYALVFNARTSKIPEILDLRKKKKPLALQKNCLSLPK